MFVPKQQMAAHIAEWYLISAGWNWTRPTAPASEPLLLYSRSVYQTLVVVAMDLCHFNLAFASYALATASAVCAKLESDF